jgi:hypothetical protein
MPDILSKVLLWLIEHPRLMLTYIVLAQCSVMVTLALNGVPGLSYHIILALVTSVFVGGILLGVSIVSDVHKLDL